MADSEYDPNHSESIIYDRQAHNTEVIPTLNMTYDEQILSLEHNLFEEVVGNEATSGNESVKVDEVLDTNTPPALQVLAKAGPSIDNKDQEEFPEKAKRFADMALLDFKKKKYSGAAEFYTMAINNNKQYADYHAKRGECYLMLKLYDKAQADVDRSLQLKPNLADGHHIKGLLEQSKGLHDDADRSFIEAIKLNPKDKRFRSSKTDNRVIRLLELECDEKMAMIYANFAPTLAEAIDLMVDSELKRQEVTKVNTPPGMEVSKTSEPLRSNILNDKSSAADESRFRLQLLNSSNASSKLNVSLQGRKTLADVFDDSETLFKDEEKSSNGITSLKSERKSATEDRSKRARQHTVRSSRQDTSRSHTPAQKNTRDRSQPRSLSPDNFSTVSGYSTASRVYKVSVRTHLPENVIGYEGVAIRNLRLDLDRYKIQRLFQIFGSVKRCIFITREDSAIAYVDFDNPESPRKAIQRYNGTKDDQLWIGSCRFPLIMRFVPSKKQPKRMESSDGENWNSRECYYWRRNGCDTNIRKCPYEHHEISRGVDFQGWMMHEINY